MTNSVEARVPFLDTKVVDYSLRVPPLFKMLGIKEKYILKKAFQGVVPKHVLERRKFGYDVPGESLWQESGDELRQWVSDDEVDHGGIFHKERVHELLEDAEDQSEDRSVARLDTRSRLLGVVATHMLHRHYVSDFTPPVVD